ncbi:MAG TPA: YetF domain-containing protein [Paenirhodobacter sp.]
MADLWNLSAPSWHFVLRGVIMYALVTGLMRVSGKRAMGQFTPFDMILLILIGNAVQNGINGGDNSLTGAMIMATTLVALNWMVAWGSARSRRVRWIFEGKPTLLAENGQIDHRTLRRQLVSVDDFLNAMRIAGCNDIARVKRATLEPNGHITIQTYDEPGTR